MAAASSVGALRAGFVDPPLDAAPMVRWWWFGPSVERAELDRELTAVAEAGFGGVEVAYVYPLAPATSTFLSEEFLAHLRFAAERARALGLRFDLTLGSGWSFGGAHIPDDLAARRLRWDRREIRPGSQEVPVAAPWPGDELVAAFVGPGSLQEAPQSTVRLRVEDGVLRVPDGGGPRVVLLAWSQRTGQQVKRAAAGAEGPVLDHYAAEAVRTHLRSVGDVLLDAVPAELVGSVFCDSLEVYEADWTPALPEEFARRCGYDLLPVLDRLVVDAPDADRVRADLHRTLTRLYEENFVVEVQRWAAGRGVPFRIQGYGTPPAMVSSYRFADLIEGEGWGWTEVTQTRWASSAAHLYRRGVVSAEVWTWVHSPSFRATPLDLQGEAHEHLLNGVNLLIGHGWPYSPADAPGLGWFFYAAGALDDRNPWWAAAAGLNAHLARLCWLLRQGEPVADVAVHVPTEDLWATMGRATGGSLDAWREASRRIGGRVPAAIRGAGFDYDLLDDDALAVTAPGRYRAVVVPSTTRVPPTTAAWLGQVVDGGGTVLAVDSPVELPGAVAVPPDELGAALTAAVGPDLALTPTTPDVGFVHRHCADAEVYLIANTGPHLRSLRVTPRGFTDGWEQWDPTLGAVVAAGSAVGDGIAVTLQPYAATVLVLTAEPVDVAATTSRLEQTVRLEQGWQVTFPDAPPEPVTLPHVWEEQPGRRHFSGSATYRTDVTLPHLADGARVVLDLGPAVPTGDGATARHEMVGPSYRVAARGPVGEVASVRVNGTEVGVVWAPPFRLDLSAAVRPGENTLEVTVANTAANALAVDEHIRRLAEESEARYGRRFRMQELDRAMETVRSGLLAVPELRIAP